MAPVCEVALAYGFPLDGILGLAGHSRNNGNLVGDHERRIKADAELADQFRAFLGVSGFEAFEELARAGAGDGAEMLDDRFSRHAQAVVGDRQRVVGRVGNQPDLPVGIAFEKVGIGEALEANAVDGVRGVADQFAQEDVLVRVERMDNQVQELLQLGFELHCFCRHERTSNRDYGMPSGYSITQAGAVYKRPNPRQVPWVRKWETFPGGGFRAALGRSRYRSAA